MLTQDQIQQFRQTVLDHFHAADRQLPWRNTQDPYAILVSEIMLQQTQAERVIPKYEAFLKELPDWQSLAEAPPETVLRLWQGLGYNRRALALQKAAQVVAREYSSKLPHTTEELQKLPGVGPYTAGAIIAFALNQPVVMIETNIRRVYLHHFFADKEGISDKELLPLIEETQDASQPRIWYYALMDYGAWMGKQGANANTRSKHYSKQSKFEGSHRQLRGKLLRLILTEQLLTTDLSVLAVNIGVPPRDVLACLQELKAEGFPVPLDI